MRVLIADDHVLLQDTLGILLEASDDFYPSCVGDLESALKAVESEGPYDLVLLDYNMPGMDGLAGLARALEASAGRPVALMSGVCGRTIAEAAMEVGAAGFVPKTLPAKSLVNAVRFMAMGERYLPPELMAAPNPSASGPHDGLTQRERQVLKGLTEGKSNKHIARDVGILEPTVKLHLRTLYRKLGVSNRTQAAMAATVKSIR